MKTYTRKLLLLNTDYQKLFTLILIYQKTPKNLIKFTHVYISVIGRNPLLKIEKHFDFPISQWKRLCESFSVLFMLNDKPPYSVERDDYFSPCGRVFIDNLCLINQMFYWSITLFIWTRVYLIAWLSLKRCIYNLLPKFPARSGCYLVP